jgi:cardiolipin synthase
MSLTYLITNVATGLAALASFVMLLGLLRSRRTPQSTLAWLLGLVFLPFVTVPLYFLLGARKFPRRAKGPPRQPRAESDLRDAPAIARVLRGSGVAPPTSGNRFELIASGELAYERLLELIAEARSSIDLTTFILGWDETGKAIVDALARRAKSGVGVRVVLDAVGCLHTQREASRLLRHAGAEVRLFMPLSHAPWRGRNNLRSHRKLAVFDGRRLFTGGMNLAIEYLGPRALPTPEPRWRDLAAVCEGPVVEAATALFESDFRYWGGRSAARPAEPPSAVGAGLVQLVPSGPDFATDTIYDVLLAAIHAAEQRLALVTPYYVPDDALQHALVLAARRGVTVEVIVPSVSNHLLADVARRGLLRELGEAGALVRYYEQGMVHAKALAIDDVFAYVGSPNFDMRSLFLNYENALCLYSAADVAQVCGFLAALSAECVAEPPKRKPSPLLEQLARFLTPEL